MSQEVATKAEERAPLVTSANRAVTAIIPRDIEQVFRIAQAVAVAGMAPKAYGKDVNAITVGIMHGMEIGFTPMAALQSIAVINGMPTIWGDGALGLVRGSGLLEDFSETLEGTGDAMTGVCVCRRVGQKAEIRAKFSVNDAKTAGLWGKQGPWTQYPQRMLQMRARSWALRDGFADVLRGLGVAEEVRDMGQLVEAADGSYVSPCRPLRAHYVEQHEKREAEAKGEKEERAEPEPEPDPAPETKPETSAYQFVNWDGEIQEGMPGGFFADALETAIREAKSASLLEGIMESNVGCLEMLGNDSDQTRAWRTGLHESYDERKAALTPKAETLVPAATDGVVALSAIDSSGAITTLQRYRSAPPYFTALKKLVAAAKDPQALVEVNRAGAESWVTRNAKDAAKLWQECQDAAMAGVG